MNARLLNRWLPRSTERLLKTDLFDEFAAPGLYPALRRHARSVTGVDVSQRIADGARRRHPGLETVLADVRELPFPDGAFGAVVSNSTLDHFTEEADVAAALREIRRVTLRGGRLVVTLDNPLNPVLAVRNRLPAATAQRLREVDYGAGWTCGPARLRRLVQDSGFAVKDHTAVMHGPRVALPAAERLSPAGRARVMAAFLAAERLERLPTRYLTGHFVAVCATAA